MRNKYLENIYSSLFKNFKIFFKSFLNFLEIKDRELLEYIETFLKNKSTTNLLNNNDKHVSSSLKGEIVSGTDKNESVFYDEIFENNEKKFRLYINDLHLTLIFINNIIVCPNFIQLKINDVKVINSEVNYTFDLKFNDNTRMNELSGIVSSVELKNFCDNNLFQKCKILRKLSQLIKKTKDIICSKDENYFKMNLSKLLQKILTDLFFLNRSIFLLFNFNEFLVYNSLLRNFR